MLAAVAFGFGTYLIVWLMHPHANAYVLLPWLLLIADRLCRTGAVRDAAALGGLLGVAYLSGQPESGMIVALATAAWVVYRLASARPDRRTAIRVGALAAAAALLGAAIGAVMILPLVEALRAVLRHVAFRPAAATQGRAQPGLSRVLGPPGWARADA